jgi:hypothetical protein
VIVSNKLTRCDARHCRSRDPCTRGSRQAASLQHSLPPPRQPPQRGHAPPRLILRRPPSRRRLRPPNPNQSPCGPRSAAAWDRGLGRSLKLGRSSLVKEAEAARRYGSVVGWWCCLLLRRWAMKQQQQPGHAGCVGYHDVCATAHNENKAHPPVLGF